MNALLYKFAFQDIRKFLNEVTGIIFFPKQAVISCDRLFVPAKQNAADRSFRIHGLTVSLDWQKALPANDK